MRLFKIIISLLIVLNISEAFVIIPNNNINNNKLKLYCNNNKIENIKTKIYNTFNI